MTSTLTRARSAKKFLRRDLEALREQARPSDLRRLLPDGWYPSDWANWLTTLDEASEFNGHVLTPNITQRMIEEASRNEAEAKRNGTFREAQRMSDEQWEAYLWRKYEEQLARQRGL